MKILQNLNLQNFLNPISHRVIFVEGSVDNMNPENQDDEEARQILSRRQNTRKDQNAPEVEEDEKKHEIKEILTKPLKLSPSAIRFLEKNIDLVKEDMQYQKMLSDSVMYLITLGQTEIAKAIPPRALYIIETSPKLKKLLPLKVREALTLITKKEIQKTQSIINEKSEGAQFDTKETAQVLGTYRIIKKQKTKAYQELSEKIEKTLISKAIALANRNLVGNVIDQEGSLNTSEELQLWEIRRAVPEALWGNIDTSHRISEIANISADKLLRKIISGEQKNNPDLMLFWESIEDLALAPGAMIDLSEEEIDKLHVLITRGNAAALIKAMQGQKVLLPSHLKAFRALKNYTEDPEMRHIFENAGDEVEYASEAKLEKNDEKKKKKAEDEIKILKNRVEESKNQGIENAINTASNITDDEKQEYRDIIDNLEEIKREFDPSLVSEGETSGGIYHQLKAELFEPEETRYIFRGVFLQYENAGVSQKYDYAVKLIDKIEDVFNKELLPEAANDPEEGAESSESANTGIIAAQNKIESLIQSDNNPITRFRKIIKDWSDLQSDKKDKQKNIIDSLNPTEKSRIKELEKDLSELEKKRLEDSLNTSELRSMVQYFMDPKKEAEKLEKKYIDSLNGRIQDHTLHNADVTVILEETDVENSRVAGLETFRSFRDKFEQVLDRKIEEISFAAEVSQSGGGTDKFLPWIKEVEEKIGTASLYADLQAEDGFESFSDIFQNPQVASQAIQGALNYNKSRVMGRLYQKLSERNGYYLDQANEFVQEALNRLNIHGEISTPDKSQKLNRAYENYINKKNSGEKTAQESHKKIDGVLASTYGKNLKEMLDEVVTSRFVDSEVLMRDLIYQDPENNISEQQFLENILTDKTDPSLLTPKRKKDIIDYVKALRGSERNSTSLIRGNEGFLGTQRINELVLQTSDLKIEADALLSEARASIEKIQTALTSKSSQEETETQQQKIERAVSDLKTLWFNKLNGEFDRLIEQYKKTCINHSHEENYFTEYFDEYARAPYDLLQKNYKKISKDDPKTPNLDTLESIRQNFVALNKALDFENGAFQNQVDYEQKSIEGEPEDVKLKTLKGEVVKDADGKEVISKREGQAGAMNTLKEIGYFEDEYDENGKIIKSGAQKAEENFRQIQADYNKKYNDFKQSLNAITNVIKLDIGRLKDQDFAAKYGQEKHEIQEKLNELETLGPQYEGLWKDFNEDKGFFGKWRKKYEKSAEDRTEALQELALWNDRKNDLHQITNQTVGIKDWLDNFNKWENENGNGKNGFFNFKDPNNWKNRLDLGAYKFSISSIFKIVKETIEILDRKTEKKTEQSAYGVGGYIFGDSYVGRFFKNKEEEAEDKRYQEWEQAYGDTESYKVQEYLYRSDDKDEVRGIINTLIGRGFMKWDDPMFLRTLNRLGSPIKFKIPDDAHVSNSSYVELQEKVKQACSSIWSPEIYRQWDQKIATEFKSVRDSWQDEFTKIMAADLPALDITLQEMLAAWVKGDYDKVDPAKFECFLIKGFEYGKMNGPGDRRMYYMIQAVSAKDPMGRTLLSMARIQNLIQEKLVSHGYIADFFGDPSSWKKDGKIVPEETEGARPGPWSYEDFQAWSRDMGTANGTFNAKDPSVEKGRLRFFYENVAQSDFAMDRMARMSRQSPGEVDHDDGENYAMGWTYTHVMQVLNSKSEGTQQLTHDFWRNFLMGFQTYAVNVLEIITSNDELYGKDNPKWREHREKMLLKLGDRLRVQVAAKQILQGNSGAARTTPLVFGTDDWEKDTMYSPRANKPRAQIDGFMHSVLRKHGADEKYHEALEFEGYKEAGAQKGKAPKDGSPARKKVDKDTEDMLSDEKGYEFFHDTNIIEEVLREQFGGGNVQGKSIFDGMSAANDAWGSKAA